MLVDCGHIVEASQLDTHVQYQMQDNTVRLISCPQCLTPIRKTVRYHSETNQFLRSIEQVKEKIRGEQKGLNKMVEDVKRKFSNKLEKLRRLPQTDRDMLMKMLKDALAKKNIFNSQHILSKEHCIWLLLELARSEQMIQDFGKKR